MCKCILTISTNRQSFCSAANCWRRKNLNPSINWLRLSGKLFRNGSLMPLTSINPKRCRLLSDVLFAYLFDSVLVKICFPKNLLEIFKSFIIMPLKSVFIIYYNSNNSFDKIYTCFVRISTCSWKCMSAKKE